MKPFRISLRAAFVCALALAAVAAHAAGVDLAVMFIHHPDVALGLAGLGMLGETRDVTMDEVKAALEKIKESVKEQAEKALHEAKSSGELSKKTKEVVDETLIKFNELQADVRDLEKKMVDRRGGEPERQKSYGEQLTESDSFKRYVENGKQGSMKLELKAVTSANAGGLIRPLYEAEPVGLPKRRFTIRDLLPVVPITTSSVDYPKQQSRTNNAATVAEGAAKPYSDYVWTNATAPVRTIAHLAKLTRQAMDDAPRLVGEVDSEMRYGLGLVEEAQILNGNGTGQNLSGIITQATAYAAPITIASPTSIDMLRLAMLQGAMAFFPATGIVLSMADWARIELTKTTEGAYLFASPQGTTENRLWGLPVVDTPAMEVDKFLVGNFQIGATLYDRMGVEVLISTENADDFEKNLATMRCEERLALAVKRPAAFVYGDFGLVT
ncbi:phage major capsid protein [uncultured Pseudacidovorax sp.]|uniref:phage major capsid protein n=1 Tax=uncultured Pseudacidovorax sp. TaxID=679313 RepID=UPI0025EE4FC5|nr:phage major capsid protein [uncultured Pseudacidovorax sp.]